MLDLQYQHKTSMAVLSLRRSCLSTLQAHRDENANLQKILDEADQSVIFIGELIRQIMEERDDLSADTALESLMQENNALRKALGIPIEENPNKLDDQGDNR
jgi:hypothetical protein